MVVLRIRKGSDGSSLRLQVLMWKKEAVAKYYCFSHVLHTSFLSQHSFSPVSPDSDSWCSLNYLFYTSCIRAKEENTQRDEVAKELRMQSLQSDQSKPAATGWRGTERKYREKEGKKETGSRGKDLVNNSSVATLSPFSILVMIRFLGEVNCNSVWEAYYCTYSCMNS